MTTNKEIFEAWEKEIASLYPTHHLNKFGTNCSNCINIDELLEERKVARMNGNYKRSDEIRNLLDQLLVFVFDLKNNETEVYHLTPSFFKFQNKFEETKKMTPRKFVEFKIQQDILAEKLANAWLFSTNAST